MNPYLLLGVLPSANQSEIRSAFRQRSIDFVGNDPLSSAIQEKLHAAFVQLSTPQRFVIDQILMSEHDQFSEKYRNEKLAFPQIIKEAIELLGKKKKATAGAAYFQKKLNLTHATAGKLIDQLERLEYVGPFNENGLRKVLKS